MTLTPYNVKVKVFCVDENEAKNVQNAVNQVTGSTNIIGSEIYKFCTKYKQNENTLKPIISDVTRNGITAAAKHIFTLRNLK